MGKIIKYSQFIKENFQDTPEEYIATALKQIQKKIEAFFDYGPNKDDKGEEAPEAPKPKSMEKIKTIGDARAEGDKEEKGDKMSFKDLGVNLESSEMSKYSKIYDSVTIKFSDSEAMYNLFISIPLEAGVPKDKEKDFSSSDIEECYIKFKKYTLDNFDLIGQISKTVKIKSIDEDFLINLKIELDDEFEGEKETLEIES